MALSITREQLFPRRRRHVKLSTWIIDGYDRGEAGWARIARPFRTVHAIVSGLARLINHRRSPKKRSTRRARSFDRELILAECAASNCSPLFQSSNHAILFLDKLNRLSVCSVLHSDAKVTLLIAARIFHARFVADVAVRE